MTQQSNLPNLYHLSGEGIQITYTPSNNNGQAELDYQDVQGSRTFIGDRVRSEKSSIGTLITVLLAGVADGNVVTLTLLVPNINMAGKDQQSFETLAIVTTNRSSFTGPPPGADQTYQVYNLQGTAQSQTTTTTGGLVISTDSDTYNIGDTIIVTLTNQGSQSITVYDHLTNCSVIQLQRQEDGTWKDVYPCNRLIATFPHDVEPGQSLAVEFDSSSYDPGLYRATESSHTAFSDEFQIG